MTLRYLDVGANNFTTAPTETGVRAKVTHPNLTLHLTGTAPCPPSYDTGLSGLTVSEGTLDPVFAPGRRQYLVEVGPHVTEIEIIPTPRVVGATLYDFRRADPSVGTPIESLDDLHPSLEYGWNRFDFRVKAKDERATLDHMVQVIRHHAFNSRLTNLTLSDIPLTPSFDSAVFTYAADVTGSVTSTTVTPVLRNSNATAVVKLNGVEDSDGMVDLEAGVNTITMEVTAGDETAIYTVIVTRAAEPGQVLVSEKSLSLTEGGVSRRYTLVLDRRPSSSVTVAVAGHAGTLLRVAPSTHVFNTSNWNQPRWVSVTAAVDSSNSNESVTLTHTATSSDSLFDGITIPSVIVNVDDQDAPDYHIRTIAVPQGSDALPLGEKALPDEEINVLDGTSGRDVYIHVVAEGDIWRPSGLWGDVDEDTIWVVDPERFGIHPLKLSALKQGRIERHVAPDSNSFDYRFNYNCHFSRDRVGGLGNRSLTVISGNDTTIWVANDTSNRLEAYRRDGSLTSGCYVAEVTDLTSSTVGTADKLLKTPFTRVSGRDYDMTNGIDGAHALTVWGIWSNGTKMWVNGPPYGIKTLDLNGGRLVKAPGFDGHISGYGLWSDGETMWVATYGWLRAYDLDTGIRRAALDVRLRSYGMPPGGLWSDGETIWVTNRIGTIDAYRLPGRSGRSRTPRATEADPLTASFASAAEAHDGENRFKLRIVFSDDVEITPEDMRDHALLVSGGTVTDAARVKGRSDLWELTVEPAGPGPVSVLAPLGRACTDQGALCTADGRSLTAGPALVVPGPPAAGPPDAPDQPEGTGVFVGGVDMEWNGVPGADSYAVQQYREGQWTDLPADGVAIAFYGAGAIISGLDPESSLWFRVRAANAHGVSDWSEMLYLNSTSQFKLGRQARADNEPASGTPVVHGPAQVGETLWADAAGIEDGNGLERVRFRYQWVSGDASADTDIAGATNSGYTLMAADEGKTIEVKVAFTDRGGYSETRTSAATDAVEAAPQPDSPATGQPTITGTVQVGEMLTVDIGGIADADGLENAMFSYQWVANDGTTDTNISDATDATYTLEADDEGKTIKVRVTVTDDAGNETTLTSTATAVVAGPEPPAMPTGLSAAAGVSHDTVTLTWNDPRDDAITGYVILRRDREIHPVGTFVTIAGDTGSTDTTYTDDTVEPDKQYVYRIKAINKHGEVSEMSDWVRANTPAVPVPDKPTGLSAAVSHDAVTLAWDAPQDDSITGYVILRRDRAIHPLGTFVTIAGDTGSADTTYTDDTVEPDKEYVYRIKAINEHGEVSERSDWVRGFTPAAPAPAGSPAR